VAALRVDEIREDLEYGGLRIRTIASIGGARASIVIDVGFGDAIEPGIEEMEIPVLLDLPAPRLRAYARETVIAEKFQAMVMLGRANSRMKDYYNIWILSRTHAFVGDRLARAIAATFTRRDTEIPIDPPDGLAAAFAEDPAKASPMGRICQRYCDAAHLPCRGHQRFGIIPHVACVSRANALMS
jgi:Nucleotidyl transferase AbiEii toxin, Type IV TA system